MNPSITPRLGFIGTGAITEAILIGLLEHGGYDSPVIVSRRSKHRSDQLKQRFDQIRIEPDNQQIVDHSDWIFIAVLPEQAPELLRQLNFQSGHKVISLVAGMSIAEISQRVFPAVDVCRVIPMPPVELGVGPIVICPAEVELERLFNRVGTAVVVTDEEQFTAFSASSSVMASFFEIVASMARWLEKQNVPKTEAARYASSVIHALSQMTVNTDPEQLQQMSNDCLTSGGLNEQVLDELKQLGWFGQLETRWDRIADRLKKTQSKN